MKKYRVREFSPAWYIVNGGGIGLVIAAGLYASICLLVTLADNGVI